MSLNNIMLDLETYGLKPGSVIRSIGAVAFDPFSTKTGEEFYVNIDSESQTKLGLTMDQSTVDWWNGPKNRKANAELMSDQQPLDLALKAFGTWWRGARGIFLWSQGSNFDGVLLENTLKAAGLPVPWKFYDTRDTRTAYDVAQFDSRTVTRAGTYHNALDDAKHQVICVQRAYAKVQGKLL